MERANLSQFKDKLREKGLLVFTPLDVIRLFKWSNSKKNVSVLLHRYSKRKEIIQLRRGLYALSNSSIIDYYIANKLVEPSYVSFETALSYHGIIPETVYTLTSATTKKTAKYNVAGRDFSFHHIKQNLFFGYSAKKIHDYTVLIADPEKSLVDYYYFVIKGIRSPLDLDKNRIKFDKVKKHIIIQYARKFKNIKLMNLILRLPL